MEGTNCGGEGGWTRVAYLNVTDTSSQCPTNFSIMTVDNERFCIKDHEGCVALPSETFGITYSQVCGYARGYSYDSSEAFGDQVRGPNVPVSGNYVDGVSITYGTPSRHVWIYAAGGSEDGNGIASYNCPCNSNPAPTFVGNDYFCEAAGGNPQVQMTHYGMERSVEGLKDHVATMLVCLGLENHYQTTPWAVLECVFVQIK